MDIFNSKDLKQFSYLNKKLNDFYENLKKTLTQKCGHNYKFNVNVEEWNENYSQIPLSIECFTDDDGMIYPKFFFKIILCADELDKPLDEITDNMLELMKKEKPSFMADMETVRQNQIKYLKENIVSLQKQLENLQNGK